MQFHLVLHIINNFYRLNHLKIKTDLLIISQTKHYYHQDQFNLGLFTSYFHKKAYIAVM